MSVPGGRSNVLTLAAVAVAAGLVVLYAPPMRARQRGGPPAPTDQGQRPVFRGGANLVTVDAYPRKDGHILEGLTPADFEIREDGVPQKVEQFEFVRVEPAPDSARQDPNNQRDMLLQAADPHNRVFVIYLDTYHSDVFGSHESRRPLMQILDHAIAPNDLFGVMTPRIAVSGLTLQRKTITIEDQLNRYWNWGAEGGAANDPDEQTASYIDTCRIAHGNELQARRKERRTLESLKSLVVYLGKLRETRSTVILVTGGWASFGPNPDGMIRQRPSVTQSAGRAATPATSPDYQRCVQINNELMMWDNRPLYLDVLRLAVRSNVVIYPFDPGGLRAPVGGLPNDADKNRIDSLLTLAAETGGIPIVNTNDLMGGANRIVNDVSAYYLLGYYSTNLTHDGGLRKIDVKVRPSGVTVVARRSYVAQDAAEVARVAAEARSTAAPVASDATVESVKAALASLVRLDSSASEMFVTASRGRSEVLVVAEVSAAETAASAGAWNRGVTVEAIATDAAGGKAGTASAAIEPGRRSVLFRIPIATGTAAHVAVTSRGQGSSTTNQVDMERSPLDLIGAPIAFRGTSAAQSALVPVADLLFRRTERAHIEWPAARALDRREARLLDRRGQPLPIAVNLTERDATAGPSVVADLILSALAPGDYVIELTAAAGSETTRRYLALRVGR